MVIRVRLMRVCGGRITDGARCRSLGHPCADRSRPECLSHSLDDLRTAEEDGGRVRE